ncbi:MAG: aminopeptidase [Lachnospiraceae bacterium]|nr:aminopeptidase [Lachnospiraceae bacterium]
MEHKSAWLKYTDKEVKAVYDYSKGYKEFLSNNKTERECCRFFAQEAEKQGYVNLDFLIGTNKKLKAGDKVYAVNMGKEIILFNIGKDSIETGMNILGAHIDSPRLDLKQNPLYEESGLAYFDTHYYGGIKKYQWVTLPLALHGVVVKKDGTVINISIGEKDDEPVFFVSDLLIHLAQDQMVKEASKVVEGEALDIIIGNKPFTVKSKSKDNEKDLVTKNILGILDKKYGIEEADFNSAEIEVVPAGKARDAGFDASMILGYGHDDRVCSYPSFTAMMAVKKPQRTSCCILVDKEEIGSVGATGMKSMFFENTVAELINLLGSYSELSLKRCLAHSDMLSSDVGSGYDPHYAEVFDKKSVAFLGNGLLFNKFTGSRGKSGSNDANAEFIAKIRKVMDDKNISYQFTELGKVDKGGGGTIAYITALYGMNVIDCGVPVLSMHAPYEAISKADIYEVYKGYEAFLESMK